MDFEEGDYIVNIYRLKAECFDWLAHCDIEETERARGCIDTMLAILAIIEKKIGDEMK